MHIMHQNFCNVVKRNINQTSQTSKNNSKEYFCTFCWCFWCWVRAGQTNAYLGIIYSDLFRKMCPDLGSVDHSGTTGSLWPSCNILVANIQSLHSWSLHKVNTNISLFSSHSPPLCYFLISTSLAKPWSQLIYLISI